MKIRAKLIFHFIRMNLEAFIWIAALLVLALSPLPDNQEHLSLCPFHNLGLDFCPGCGIGRSITLFFHAHWKASFEMHPLGGVAVFILLYRIYSIIRKNYPLFKSLYYGQQPFSTPSGTGGR